MPAPTTPSKIHTVIIVLLVWVIALLVFGIGYMVYRDQSADATDVAKDDTAMSCEERIDAALKSATTVESDVSCVTIDSYAGLPSFSYPVDWDVVAQAISGRDITAIRVSKDPLWLCNGCDGPANPLNIYVYNDGTPLTLDAYIADRYSAANGYTNVIKGLDAIGVNATDVMRVSGEYSGMSSGSFEHYIFLAPGTVVIVANDDTADADANAAFDVITSSLDFSEVE